MATSTALPKLPPGKKGEAVPCKSNLYPLVIAPNLVFYKHDIRMRLFKTIKGGVEKSLELTNASRSYAEDARKVMCVKLLPVAVKQEKQMQNNEFIYDRAAILFTTKELVKKSKAAGDEKSNPAEIKITLPGPTATELDAEATRIEIVIKKADDGYQVSTNDVDQAAKADFQKGHDKNIFEVLNIATSQQASKDPTKYIVEGNSKIHLVDPTAFNMKQLDMGAGKIIDVTVKKTVKPVKGAGGKTEVAVAVDVMRTARHVEQNLAEKMFSLQAEKGGLHFAEALKNMKCRTTYGRPCTVTIKGVTGQMLSQTTFTDDKTKKKMTVVEYMKSKYNVVLKEANRLPGVIDRFGFTFAPECLTVMEQGVTPDQTSKFLQAQIVRNNAIDASVKMQEITKWSVGSLSLNSKDAIASGISLPAQPKCLEMNGRKLAAAQIVSGDGSKLRADDWKDQKFFAIQNCDKWAIARVCSRFEPGYDDTENFLNILHRFSSTCGMKVSTPVLNESWKATRDMRANLEDFMSRAKAKGAQLMLYISDLPDDHDLLKFIERRVGLPTQQIKDMTFMKIIKESSADTVLNIMKKMNVKLGGINHIVDDCPALMEEKTMFMGLFMDKPESMTTVEKKDGAKPTVPVVIGVSANNGIIDSADPAKKKQASAQYFCEKVVYANPTEFTDGETLETTLKNTIVSQIKSYRANRGVVPLRIFVYINGVADAERAYWRDQGVAIFKDAFAAISAAYKPNLILISASDSTFERFFVNKPATGPPGRTKAPQVVGLVIDDVATNPHVNEFFLLSAKALQGTQRPHKYTYLAHTHPNPLSMDDIEDITWKLCFLHEYTNKTISDVSPVRVAKDAAKRGRALFSTYRKEVGLKGPFDLAVLNTSLGSEGDSALGARRTV